MSINTMFISLWKLILSWQGFSNIAMTSVWLLFSRAKKTTKALHTKGWFSKRLAVNSREIMTFFGTIIIVKLVVIKDYGRFPFDQNLRCEFPGMSMGEWYRLSSVENDKPHSFIRLEFFNDFEV